MVVKKKIAIVTSGLEGKPSFVRYIMFVEKVTKSGIKRRRHRPFILFRTTTTATTTPIIIIINLSI